MSVRSADTERERRRALTALVAAYPVPASPPWSSARKTRTLDNSSSRYRSRGNSNVGVDEGTKEGKCDATYDGGGTATATTTLDGSDALVGVAEQVLSWSGTGGRRERELDGVDMCASTWKSVESMARTLAAGQSVVSTIAKCYSMPSLGRRSDRGGAARRSGLAETEMMHTSLLSERLAAKALAIFHRCAYFCRNSSGAKIYIQHYTWLATVRFSAARTRTPTAVARTELKHVQCTQRDLEYQENTVLLSTVRT